MKTASSKSTRRKPRQTQETLPEAPDFGARAIPLPTQITSPIKFVIARYRRMRVLEGIGILLGALGLMVGLRCLLDWWLDFPQLMRMLLLAGDVVLFGWILWRFILRPLFRRMSQEQAALLIERHFPLLRSALISTVQLTRGGRGCVQGAIELVERLVQRTRGQLHQIDLRKVVPEQRMKRFLTCGVLAAVVVAGTGWHWHPDSWLLLQRYAGLEAPLPSKTHVISVTGDLSIPAGGDALLTARAEGVIPRSGRVFVEYASGESREFTAQPDLTTPDHFIFTLTNVQSDFTYRFFLNDGRGSRHQVRCEISPFIESMIVTSTPPEYTELGTEELSPGSLAALQGSLIRIEVQASQPLTRATWFPQGDALEAASMTIDSAVPSRAAIEFTVPASGLEAFTIPLVSKDDAASLEDALYRFQIIPDRPPVIRLIEPSPLPTSVTPSTPLPIVAEVSDDFGLSEIHFCYQMEGEEGVSRRPLRIPEEGRPVAVRWIPGREEPPLAPGDSITVWIEALDNNTLTGPGLSESERFSFDIVTQEEKRREIEGELHRRAVELQRLMEAQRSTAEEVGEILRRDQ